MPKGLFRGVVCCALLGVGSAPASAEIVRLSSGRTLSVQSHRMDGESVRLVLRGGGEIECPRAFVVDIEPDEVPYPDRVTPADGTIGSGEPFGEIIDRVSAEHGVDPQLVRAVIAVESNYQPAAVSRKGAVGLMQLMPATARQYGADPFDPTSNIEAGIKHLRSLLARFDLSVALAAYNAGEAAVHRFGGMPPYRETREYVARILTLLRRR